MQYTSTRDSRVAATSAQAIAQGISAEGGLFLPQSMPRLTMEDIARLAALPYIDRATWVLRQFLTPKGGWANGEVAACVAGAYTGSFSHPSVAPLRPLNHNTDVLELFCGPTSAFKDLALQLLPRLLTASAKKVLGGKEITVLVATSGDTGKAALEGFRDVEGTNIAVFYPVEGVSAVQKRQMVSQPGNNVRVVAVEGNFDDAQTGVKDIFINPALLQAIEAKNQVFSSANSINWGRVVPQVVYYISAYCDLLRAGKIAPGEEINFVVPTGNFGNILAGYFAKEMGLPIAKLICASNQNRVLTDFLQTGVYDRNRDFYLTSAPSMDILISSNLERLLWLANGHDSAQVAEWMQQLRTAGRYKIPGALLQKLQKAFAAGACSQAQCAAAIRGAWEQNGYLSDTHTACALHVLEEYRAAGDQTRTVVVSTASPFKFAASVLDALGLPPANDEFAALEALEAATGVSCPAPLQGLREKPVRFPQVCAPAAMAEYVWF
ncbi:MAG: threonine synthase [Oscillospiraceae bacterium]|nr:threonine synthase [Oscillospiraceae bacterium]